MDEARFQYRCRRCEALFTEGVTGAARAEASLVQAIVGHRNVSIVPAMLTMHRCSDGCRGIADLVGYVVQRAPGAENDHVA